MSAGTVLWIAGLAIYWVMFWDLPLADYLIGLSLLLTVYIAGAMR